MVSQAQGIAELSWYAPFLPLEKCARGRPSFVHNDVVKLAEAHGLTKYSGCT